MKLYHIDRTMTLKEEDLVNINKNIDITDSTSIVVYNNVLKNYKDGLSYHGIGYYCRPINDCSGLMDVIFEYERLLKYPDKLSRYQSLFGTDKDSLLRMINKITDGSNYKIYEIDTDNYEKHDMNLLKECIPAVISELSYYYWNNIPKEFYPLGLIDEEPLYEYLIALPCVIGKEVKIEDI